MPTETLSPEQQREVKALIAYYDERGWDWGMAACYTLSRALGLWPPPRPDMTRRGGRPRRKERGDA